MMLMTTSDLPLERIARGKVRDVYAVDADRLLLVATDRVSAYDVVMARAVGRLASLAELTVPLCKVGGRVLLIKGEKADEEVNEAEHALHTLKAVHIGTLVSPTGRIVILEKRSATPRDYPRADGEPTRSPLRVARR